MQATRVLLAQRQPMIQFLGKRTIPKSVDHTPHAHPAAPSSELPSSFAQYRQNAQQHGPLGGQNSSRAPGGASGASLGSVQAKQGEYFDRNELPARFHRTRWTLEDIEIVESGGASMFV